MASSHHVRAEGWLFLKVGDEKGTAKKEYVVIDGFVLRIFKDEPAGAHMEETMVAHEIIDLRMTETLSPVDPYKPHDAVTLVAKSEGGKKKPKSITFESEGQHIAEASKIVVAGAGVVGSELAGGKSHVCPPVNGWLSE